MKESRVFGIVLVVFSLILWASNVRITGAVVGTHFFNSLSLVALAILITGLALIIRKDRNYAQEILDQRRYVDDTRELEQIARKMNYTLHKNHREGTRVYNGESILTVIPHHRRVEGKGTVKSILEALATGEPSFRRKPR